METNCMEHRLVLDIQLGAQLLKKVCASYSSRMFILTFLRNCNWDPMTLVIDYLWSNFYIVHPPV